MCWQVNYLRSDIYLDLMFYKIDGNAVTIELWVTTEIMYQ